MLLWMIDTVVDEVMFDGVMIDVMFHKIRVRQHAQRLNVHRN